MDEIGEHRDLIAGDRDRRAEAHDRESDARDTRADARDERALARERAVDDVDRGAAADRAGALRDRRAAASDRAQAADDRNAASLDRSTSAQERAASFIDGLTGAQRRDMGVISLRREVARAKRTEQPFTLVFVDVDNLKTTNDSLGHAAGDDLLREVADAIRRHLRSYDVVIRFGGDEFLCGLLDVTVDEAARRFSLVNDHLAASRKASVTVGIAWLDADDTLDDLIRRADEALYETRRRVRSAES
jgi:diguanylate cyclase (GGDEF)-like protein